MDLNINNANIIQRIRLLENASPITGGFVTELKIQQLICTLGFRAGTMQLGHFKYCTPSFAPGNYEQGDGKDLGHALEFKTEMQLSYTAFR